MNERPADPRRPARRLARIGHREIAKMKLRKNTPKILAALALLSAALTPPAWAGAESSAAKPLYENDFEKAAVGKLPDDFMALNGDFTVKAEGGNQFLELPGAPLDTFSVLFGPAETADVAVSARVFGTAKGRRYPTFAVGLNGVSGYKLRVAPGRQALELVKDDELKAGVPFDWKPGTWTLLRLQSRKVSDGHWLIQGKAWPQGGAEPAQWQLACDEKTEPPAGRASVLGSPFSGTPIRFDDLVVSRVAGQR